MHRCQTTKDESNLMRRFFILYWETLKYDTDALETNSIVSTSGGENKWLVQRVAAIDGRCRH
jgi:hypothetical protein